MTNGNNKNPRRTTYRGNAGSIAFGVVLAFILVILGVGFMAMMLYMGGQNETKNAVDAGVLNIGKQIIDNASTTLGLLNENERIYYDVTAKNPNKIIPGLKTEVTMRQINRVWAKALLIGINADAAQKEGNVGSGIDNAQKAIDGAQTLSDELQKKVLDTEKWRAWFGTIADQNSVRMLGKDAAMSPLVGSNWQNSCMMRGAESNIELVGDEPNFALPPGYQLSKDVYTGTTRQPPPPGSEGRFFLKGYTPITVAGKTVWQIPFPYDEITHLVSGPKFNMEKPENQKLEWNNPIPNAFSAEGAAVKAGGGPGQKAMSWVITNPHQPFRLSIPHSFLKVHIDNPVTHYMFFPPIGEWVNFGDDQEYNFHDPNQSQTGPTMPLGGVGCATSTATEVDYLGSDVFGRPIDYLMFPPELSFDDGDKEKLEAIMVNRLNEMLSDGGTSKTPPKALTADDLHDCLMSNLVINTGALASGKINDFYIFSEDGKTVKCMPKYQAIIEAPWLIIEEGNPNMIANEPDGTETKIVDDADFPIAPVDADNVTSVPIPFPPFTNFLDIGWASWDEDVFWTPGSGYNGCLGTIRLHRYTKVKSLSICVPVI